jgi:hypothetical protein
MLGLFSLIGSVVGMGFQIAGQQQQMKAAEKEASASGTIATFQAQQQAAQYQLYQTMQQRAGIESLRRGQRANAANFATLQGQGGNQFGSAYGGARGQTGGETSTAISGISENMDFAQQNFNLNQQIDMQKVLMAQYQTQAAQGQGEQALGGDIMSISKSFGNVFSSGGSALANLSGGGGAGLPGNIGFGLPLGMLG